VTHYQLVPPGYAAITLDDGPSKTTKQGRNYTTEVLDVLKEKQVLATFFVVGHALDRKGGPALVQRAALEGHSIANHSWSHSYMSVDCFNEDDTINRPCTDTEAAAEILNTQSLLTETLAEVGMRPVPFFRFPGGNSNGRLKDLVSSLGFSSVFWDIETNDTSSDTTPESYVTHTVSEFNRRDGGIILAHDRREITANTLGTLIDTLRVQEKFEGFVVFRQP
jgi:peptidoglycan/xylan/chitin deacetylase (PgdA/CDA1 family)